MSKPRTYQAHGFTAEILGPTNKCIVFINGASHILFSRPFKSIRAARIAFMQYATRKAGGAA